MNIAARHDLNKTLALLAALLAGWSLGVLQGEVQGAPPNEVAPPHSLEKAPEPTATPGPAKQVDPRAIVTKADAEAEFGYQVGPPRIEVRAGVADCVYRKADSPSNIRVVVFAGDAAKDFQESKRTSIRLGSLIEELADIGDAAYYDSERIRVLCGDTHFFVEASYFSGDFAPGFQQTAMERRRASVIRLARKAVERIAAGQTQLVGDELPVANDAVAVAPQQPVSRWSLERVRENTLFNHFLRGLRIGLVGVVLIGGPLLLLLVLVRRITGYTNRSDAASEPRNPEKVGGSRLFWKGVLISAALCLVLCGAGGATAYSPNGPVDSIGGGLLIFCGYLTFFVGIVVTEIHAYYGPRAPGGMAVSDLIIPEARRLSVSIPWLLLILVGTMGLYVVGGRLIGQRKMFLGTILEVSVILIGSILGITVMRSTGRRSVSASIVGGAAGCAVTFGGCLFFAAALIPPEPGMAVTDPFAGMLCGTLSGGFCGSVVGLFAGLGRAISEGRNQRSSTGTTENTMARDRESNEVVRKGRIIHGLLWIAYGLVCALAAGVWIFHILPNDSGRETLLRVLCAETFLTLGTGATALSLCRRYPPSSFLLIPFSFFLAAMLYGFAFFDHTPRDGQLFMGFGFAFGLFLGTPVGTVLSMICWLWVSDRSKPKRRIG